MSTLTCRSAPRSGTIGALTIWIAFACSSCVPESDPTPAHVFTDVAIEAGLTHRHEKPVLDPKLDNIMPWMSSVGAAAAAGDYDNDGQVDLYVTNSNKGAPNWLYHNNGDGTFTDVAAVAGVADVNDEGGVSMDCIWADFDNDGWLDLYLVRWGTNRLFRSNGDGTFREVTAERFRTPGGEPGTPWANGNAAIALDFNADGRLDIYVGNYFREVDLWHLESTRIMHDSFENARNGGPNQLYRQEADGSFTDVARSLGVADTGWTLAVGSADLNNDGWPDLYVANDFGPDQLFMNDGRGGFVNVSDEAIGHDTRKGMNVDFGDFNNDGWLDIYVTNITTAQYLQEGNMLWRNNGPRRDGTVVLMDVARESGTSDGGWGWGAKFLDYDNDGDLDLFAVNGFVSAGEGEYWYDLATWTVTDSDPADSRNWPPMGDRSFSGYESFRFWRNEGGELFRRVDAEVGLDSTRDGRGVVCFDYDNDGDVDLFVANQGQPPHLFRNDAPPQDHHWIGVRLVADPATGLNADAIGTRVTVITATETQIRERDGGVGYAGQSESRLHFGLGHDDRVRLLEVRWPDGGLQYLEDVEADLFITVRQNPDEYVAIARVTVEAPTPRAPAGDVAERQVPEIDTERLDELLSTFEDRLRQDPSNHAAAYLYRRRCADYGRHVRAIRFFQELIDREPEALWPRMELSVAYVDQIPTCGGIAAIVCKGTLARRSLDQLDQVIATHGSLWVAHYARGMNHLHWPRALSHTPDAIADFEQCLRLQQERRDEARPFHARTFALLGDAHAKIGSYDQARHVWQEGLAAFPDSAELVERAALDGEDALREFVKERRSLEQPIDTDLSFVDDGPGASTRGRGP